MEYLRRQQRLLRDKFFAEVLGGRVPVYFDEALEVTYMEQLPVHDYGDYHHPNKLLDLPGIGKKDTLFQHFPVITPSNLKFIFLPVKDLTIIQQLDPDFSKLSNLLGKKNHAVFAIAREGIDGGDFHARMFAPSQGINEDPATGSAQSAFVHALARLDLLNDQQLIKVEQGYEMDRPSILYNRYSKNEDQLQVKTGGRCHLALKGQLFM